MVEALNTMTESVMNILKAASDWVTFATDAPSARAIVFGVQIGGHLFVEGFLLVVILFLLSQKSYKPPKHPLTKKEIDELCDEWVPESLIPPITKEMQCEPPILESAAGPDTVINDKEVVNFASANYLGLVGHEKLLESCTSALEKYGVGSCGPHCFYGTIDVHLDCEARIAEFLGTPDSILYSYGLSAMFSAIPAFWMRVFTGEYKMNSGQIAPLDEIIRLKEKYRFRVLLDESNSLGVLGSSGRGLTEHYGVAIEKIDIVTAAMGHALATEGGFCTGSARVIDHQRLGSSGYVFTASLPPYLASAAITAIDVLEDDPQLITNLKTNIRMLSKGLSDLRGLEIASDQQSPIVYLRLKKSTGSSKCDLRLLEDIAALLLKEDGVFVATSKRSILDKCDLPVGIRLFVSAAHTEADLMKAYKSMKRVAALVFTGVD